MVNSVSSKQLAVISGLVGFMVLWCYGAMGFEAGVIVSGLLPFGVPQFLFEGGVDKGSGGDGGDGGGEGGSGDGGGEQSAVSSQQSGAQGGDGGSNDGGGAGGSDFLNDLINETNEKLGGESVDSSEKAKVKSEKGEEGDEGPSGRLNQDKGDKGDEDNGSDKDPGEFRDGFDPNDLVEVEGADEKFFYHPEVHGKDTGQGSTYKKRDDAEYALAAKSSKLHELVNQLNEAGKGIGAIDVPEWFGNPNDPDTILDAGDMETAVKLPNEDLRSRVKEMDTLITKLSDRNRSITSQKQNTEAIEQFQAKKKEYATKLQDVMDDLGIGDKQIVVDFQSENPTKELETALTEARDQKVADELKPLVTEYQKYKKDEDARLNDDDYPEQLEKKFKAIEKKRTELTNQYNEKLNITNEIKELANEVPDPEATQNETGETKAAKTKRIAGVLKELGSEVEHPMFESVDPTGVKQFFKFAFDNAEKYNNLQTTFDANQALKDFDARMQKLRTEARRKEVEDKNSDKDKRDDMPGYGDQNKLNANDKPVDVREANKKTLEQLREETNRTISN